MGIKQNWNTGILNYIESIGSEFNYAVVGELKMGDCGRGVVSLKKIIGHEVAVCRQANFRLIILILPLLFLKIRIFFGPKFCVVVRKFFYHFLNFPDSRKFWGGSCFPNAAFAGYAATAIFNATYIN